MATTAEAAAIITRNADPHGDGFGIAANVSYSFYGGGFAFSANQQAATLVVLQLWAGMWRGSTSSSMTKTPKSRSSTIAIRIRLPTRA